MPFSFRRADTGSTHICAHRGYCLHYPENTLPAFEMAVKAGATTCEIDVMLTRDGEAVVIHDATLDRTTNGHGFVDNWDLDDILRLNAAAKFPGYSGSVQVPTLREVTQWAVANNIGLELEMKEGRQPERLSRRIIDILAEESAFDHVIVISFDHMDLKRIREMDRRIKTEGITHARHGDIVSVLKSCGAEAASIELKMFHRDDAIALHAAGFYHRVHLPRPDALARYWAAGRDVRPDVISMLREGLIDSISGDDVGFLRQLMNEAGQG